jgi:hypothetical protein
MFWDIIYIKEERKRIMNETLNPDASQPQGASQPEGTPDPQTSSRQEACLLNSLCAAVNEGSHRAKAAAEKAIPKVKAAVSDATYWLGFGVSFATVFSYTVIKELAPEALKRGCRDGAQAGQRTAEDLASEFHARPDAHGSSSSPGPEPSGQATQPGVT